MNSTTKIWVLRVFLFILSFMLFEHADQVLAIPASVVIGGFIFTFYKNPFEKEEK